MSLSEVQHQSHALRAIQRALTGGRMPHAYLFHGPDGVGKELTARGLAQLLLCRQPRTQRPPEEPAAGLGLPEWREACGGCEDCRMVRGDAHPDLHLVHRYLYRDHPDSDVRRRKGLEIGVEVIRHFVIDRVGQTALRGRAKVFIIREADRITTAAQNALLKTLEEPPGPTFLILLTSNLDRLLATTLSRCQPVRFDTLPLDFVADRLAALVPELPAEQREWYARFADGSLGAAMQAIEAGLYELNVTVIESMPGGSRAAEAASAWTEAAKGLGDTYRKRDPDITDTEATRRGLLTLMRLAANWHADITRVSAGQWDSLYNHVYRARIERAASGMDLFAAAEAVQRIATAERQLDQNVNVQLCIDCLLNDLPGRGLELAATK